MSFKRRYMGPKYSPLDDDDKNAKLLRNNQGSFNALTVALSVLTVILLGLSVTFIVLYATKSGESAGGPIPTGPPLPTIPEVFTAETVPQNVNDFVLEWVERKTCGDGMITFNTPTSAINGLEPCYNGVNTTASLPFLDQPLPTEVLYEEFRDRLEDVLDTDQMSEAQKIPLRRYFNQTGIYDKWHLSETGTPQDCQDMYRVLDNLILALNAGWFAYESYPQSLDYYEPEIVNNMFTTLAIYNSTTVEHYIQELKQLENTMKAAREEDFHTRQHDYILSRFGVGYSLSAFNLEMYDSVDGLDILWDSSDFSGGSSAVYDMVILKGAEVGFSLSIGEDAELKTAIEQVEAECVLYLNYLLTTVASLPLYDDITNAVYGSFGAWYTEYPLGFANNVSTMCIAGSLEGIWAIDGQQYTDDAVVKVLEIRSTAEPIYNASIPDYLGWLDTWLHVFVGTEAMVTELGYFEPVDCPDYETTDPAWLRFKEQSSESDLNAVKLGQIHAPSTRPTQLLKTCSGGSGLTQIVVGDYVNKGFGIMYVSPSEPKVGGDESLYIHERHHVQHLDIQSTSCAECYYYRYSRLIGASGNEDMFGATEGSADYVADVATLHDTNLFPPDTLTLANSVLFQQRSLIEFGGLPITVAAGYLSESDFINLATNEYWYPFGPSGAADLLLFETRKAIPTITRTQYYSGSYRHNLMRNRVEAECGAGYENANLKRVRDSSLVIPAMSLDAQDRLIDDFISTNCTVWPYRSNAL
jgi:hypothetical protein